MPVIFDVFEDWFARDDFEGCSFINVLLEMGVEHSAGRASSEHGDNIRLIVRGLAEDAGRVDADKFAHSWHLLMKGTIAAAGDARTAPQAIAMPRQLIDWHRP